MIAHWKYWWRHAAVAAVFGAIAVSCLRLHATTVLVDASHEASIFANNPANGSGAGNGLFAGTNGSNSPRRALVSFDLGGIPTDAVIQSAELTLYLGQYAGMGGGSPPGPDLSTIRLHRITAAWGEGTTQLRDPPTNSFNGIGQGDPAADGDVTWDERFFAATPSKPWTKAGGDFTSTPSAELVVTKEIDAAFTWPSTAATVGDVAYWLAHPTENYGWMLVNAVEDVRTNFRAFYSREVASEGFHPKLAITYTESSPPNANFDEVGDVDGADFLAWQRGFGTLTNATHAMGDATGEGAVNALDLAEWRTQFGSDGPPAIAAPEPRALIHIAAALIAGRLWGVRTRRRPA